MPGQPRIRVDAAPLYPVCDPSSRDAVLAGGALPSRVWTQNRPGNLGGSLARDITILRRGLDGHVQRQQLALRANQRRHRLWLACGGLGFLVGVASLFF